MPDREFKPATRVAQALGWRCGETGAVILPLHVATTFARDKSYEPVSRHGYARDDNPTFEQPEALIASLEGGAAALSFASGMAACTAAFQALRQGDHVVVPDVLYFGLPKWLDEFARSWGLEVDFVPTGDLNALAAAMRPGQTKLVWIQTPCNPVWTVTGIAAAAKIAHDSGTRLAVDSTVATPVLTRPIEHGADIVVHSATKYLNGHSDEIAGMIVTAVKDEYWERIGQHRVLAGLVLGSFDAFLLLRGMRTLYLRVNATSGAAQRIAEHFSEHSAVAQVLYPGLPDHRGHAAAMRQMKGGFGGVLSIRIKACRDAARAVASGCRLFLPATLLGGIESLIVHRKTVEGEGSRTPDDLLRISVGIEDPDDLIADLETALAAACG